MDAEPMKENVMNVDNHPEKPRLSIAYLLAILYLVAVATVTVLSAPYCTVWHGILVGVLLIVMAIPLHIFGRKRAALYLAGFCLNAVGSGIAIATYYADTQQHLQLADFFLAILPGTVILGLAACLFAVFSKKENVVSFLFIILHLLLLAGAVYFWVTRGAVYFSFCFFCLLMTLCFQVAIASLASKKEGHWLRALSFAGFGIATLVTFVVILILSEGDALDTLDFDISLGSSRKKKR